MKRIRALQLILEAYPDQPVVSNCGATCREAAYLERSDRILYLEDSMGMASSVGLGLAIALQDRAIGRVIVLEGDGSLLMNFTSLASIAYHRPEKLLLAVLDNGVYASTGGQPTYASRLDLAAFAQAGGISTLAAKREAELQSCLKKVVEMKGPVFLHVRIEPENTPGIPLFLEDPAVLAYNFSQWIERKAGEKPPGKA